MAQQDVGLATVSQPVVTQSLWRVAAQWFGWVYLLAAVAGAGLSAGGSGSPLGLPLDGPRSAVIGAVGAVTVLASRSRQAVRTALIAGGFGTLAVLAVAGMLRGSGS
jgi:hypothetical protein